MTATATLPRPRTLLIDSTQLESGDALDKEFRTMAADEIERFQREIVQRTVTSAPAITSLIRISCARSEHGRQARPARREYPLCRFGLDADRGVGCEHGHPHSRGPSFGTQLLCEQVVGRALRRQSYDLNEEGLFAPNMPTYSASRSTSPPSRWWGREKARSGAGRGLPGRDAVADHTFPRKFARGITIRRARDVIARGYG